MSRRGELFAILADLAARQADALAELARLEGTMGEPPKPPAPAPKSRPRSRPLQVCESAPVDELAAARARRALARYPR